MNRELLVILEEALGAEALMPAEPPEPFAGAFPLSDEWLRQAREEGRP